MQKGARKWIEYYWNYVNSDKYKEEKIKRKAEYEKATHDSDKEENIQEEEQADYYEDSIVTHLSICDVLSNDGVTKVLKKLYSLPKKKFKVHNHYKKPSIFHKYDYVHLQYSESGYGCFAEIELLEDKYIKSIKAIWAQINSYFALIEYCFTFKKPLDEDSYNHFVYDNIRNLTSKDYIIWHRISKEEGKRKDDMDYGLAEQMTEESFPLICQHYITSFLYSEQGKNNPLINMEYRIRKAPIDIDRLYLKGIVIAYYNKKSNYVICSDYDKPNYCMLTGNNRFPQFNICEYIVTYRNEFFYCFFGYRELKLFEREFSKFSTGRKSIAYNREFKKLLNKLQSVSEVESRKEKDIYTAFNEAWDFYSFGKKQDLKKYHENDIAKYKKIYENNFSYLKVLSEINYTKNNQRLMILTVIISIVAIFISILTA